MGTDLPAEQYEEQHVHAVYQEIASHFSSTRHKAWPIVERFLNELAPASIGIDAGCGNGKYLAVNAEIFIIGSDRSVNLVTIAKKHAPHSVVVGDALALPHRPHTMDFAISIAVIHHLASVDRRTAAISEILQVLKPDAKALIYVWALEQKSSRRGWDEGDEQDVMVPWVMKESGSTPDKTFHRFYHLYHKGELEAEIAAAGGRTIDSGYERDNWWAIAGPAA